jgi:DNA topoisomerase-1
LFQDIPGQSAEGPAGAGLRYFTDSEPGLTRTGKPGHFRYSGHDGKPVRNKSTLARIARLAIPPAWRNVWIAPHANAHLQATGRDAKGRKQYRYHPDFSAMRDGVKYAHLLDFAEGLPALRKRVKADLRRPGLPRQKVLATVVTLLEETLVRVGNEDYARTNGSFGLTTLRNRHVRVRGQTLTFQFKGKSGKTWNLSIRDRRIARIVSLCQDLPGQHLFEYRDADGVVASISSSDVNAYLRDTTGRDVTAKDFRTWAGTVQAAIYFSRMQGAPSKAEIRNVVAAVAAELGNTIAVCRRCYIHPDVIAAYEAGGLKLRFPKKAARGLSAEERGVLSFLRRRSVKRTGKMALGQTGNIAAER